MYTAVSILVQWAPLYQSKENVLEIKKNKETKETQIYFVSNYLNRAIEL